MACQWSEMHFGMQRNICGLLTWLYDRSRVHSALILNARKKVAMVLDLVRTKYVA